MRRGLLLAIPAFALTWLLMYLECSTQVAGIETTNGATVVSAESSIFGTAPPYSRVSVFDAAYVPGVDSGVGMATFADDSGRYDVANLVPGVYTVIVEMQKEGLAAAFRDVTVGSGAFDSVRSMTLQKTGGISGTVTSTGSSLGGILVYIAGTGYYRVLSGPGQYQFESVPAGVYYVQACGLMAGGWQLEPVTVSPLNRKKVEVLAGMETAADTLAVE